MLLRNEGNGNHWLTVRLVGTDSNRQGIGALVRVHAAYLRQVEEVQAGTSMALFLAHPGKARVPRERSIPQHKARFDRLLQEAVGLRPRSSGW